MRAHFLTRAAFDTLLKKTQHSIKEAPNQHTREALALELAILLKAGEAFGEQYLRNGEAYVERIPRARWKEESSRYIAAHL